MKICTKCKIEKNESEFYKLKREPSGLNYRCKICIQEYRNSPGSKERDRKYHQSEKYRTLDKIRDKNPIRRKKVNNRRKNRRKTDPIYRLRRNLSRRTNLALKRGFFSKKSSILQYLGCDIEFLKKWLELQFQHGMTWDNYGFGSCKWNIDHKIPLSSAISEEDVYKLSNYFNLQPLWQVDNLKKSNKIKK